MGRFALALMCVLVGCSDGGGLVIEVHTADPAVDRVRLYLGVGDKNATPVALGLPVTQTTVANSTRAQIDEVTYWSRDPGNELDLDESVVDGVARFILVRGTTTHDIAALVAVGFAGESVSGTATLFDVAIPGSHYAKYTLDLVEPDGDFETPPGVVGLGTWSADLQIAPHEASCVGVLRPNKTPSAAFIVTPDDLDCDGIPDGDDCTPNVWFGASPPTIETASCLTPVNNASCEIGGAPCRDDGTANPSTCASTHYCVPQSTCDSCGTDLACARDVTTAAGGLPATVQCKVGVDPAGKICQDTLTFNPAPMVTGCGAPKVGDSQHPFAGRLVLPDTTIEAKRASAGCGVELRVTGTTVTSGKQIGMMVALPLPNSSGLGIPVVLQIDTTLACGVGSCSFDGSDVQNELAICLDRWSPPTPVMNVPIGADDPTLTQDMKQLWFNRNEVEIWHMERSSPTGPWMNLRNENLGDAVALTTTPHVSPDGQKMHFSSNRLGAADQNLYESTFTAATGWGIPVVLQGTNTIGNDEEGGATYLGGAFMAFSRGAEAGPHKLFHSSFQNSLWTTPIAFSELAPQPGLDDRNPFVSEDGLTIYFSSNRRTGHGQELFLAKRSSTSATFGPPIWLSELGSLADDMDPWVSPDGKTIYFASNRSGTYQLFEAHR
ncbi:MAG: PD40 domain-containing protein [Myxococcales bacterium]|nr:PD40 domain-containing protein [Myxococcales bacterium]